MPAILTGPGFFGGGEARGLFSTVDAAPALLDAAAISVPESMAGHSILPVIRDRKASRRDEAFIQIRETQTGRALRTQRWKYSVTAEYDAARDRADTYREDFLYDLDNDPYELVNLAGMSAFRKVSDNMKQQLLAWIKSVEGATPQITAKTGVDPFQRLPAKGHGLSPERLMIDPYKSPLARD